MNARWIAEALLAGADHLVLDQYQFEYWLAESISTWVPAPYSSISGMGFGMFRVQFGAVVFGVIRTALAAGEMPSGTHSKYWGGAERHFRFADHYEVWRDDDGNWHVPLFASDPKHCVNGFSLNWRLAPDHEQVLRPHASTLLEHTPLESDRFNHALIWDAGQWMEARAGIPRNTLFRAIKSGRIRTPPGEAPPTLAMLGGLAAFKRFGKVRA